MSWHFLQGQEAASWEGNSLDGAPSALSSLIPMPATSSLPDRPTDASNDSPSGTMCGPSTGDPGAGTSMSSAVDSPAKTSAPPDAVPGSLASGVDCGPSSPGSLAKYDPATHSWKTAQYSLLGGLELFSETWPRWGTMRGGELFPQETPARSMSGSASGLWPTPTVNGNYNRVGASATSGDGLATAVRRWPTPTCPAPHDSENTVGRTNHGRKQMDLAKAVGMSPTPCARDWRHGMSQEALARRQQASSRGVNLSEFLQREDGSNGQLNPTWVEWLMGWPSGWTALEPLATDRFREWWQQHGGYSPMNESLPSAPSATETD